MVAVTTHAIWAVVIPIIVIACFAATLYLFAHDPPAREPGPGHPAYEGEDAED
jgi:hypothetical protein